MEDQNEKKRLSLVARINSTNHAWRGFVLFIKATPNVRMHFFFLVLVLVLGVLLKISPVEWALVVVAIGFVLIDEGFNTAIEIDIDLTSPDYHPYARDTKDVAAGSVLMAVGIAVLVGIIIFLPKIISLML
jgi:diacylglycerol kinase